jgi:hypothetical protein
MLKAPWGISWLNKNKAPTQIYMTFGIILIQTVSMNKEWVIITYKKTISRLSKVHAQSIKEYCRDGVLEYCKKISVF